MPVGEPVRPGSMGRPLPGFRLEVVDEEGAPAEEGELSLDPATVPTFFRGYLGEAAVRRRAVAHRRPRAPRRRRLSVVRGPPGRRDPLGRLPDRPLRGRVGPGRASGRRRGGGRGRTPTPSADRSSGRGGAAATGSRAARSLRASSGARKRATAPYKYPRIVSFVAELPKTASGKIKRAELRAAERRVGRRPLGLTVPAGSPNGGA